MVDSYLLLFFFLPNSQYSSLGFFGFEFEEGEKMMNVDVYEEEDDEDHRKLRKKINDLVRPH